LWILLSSGFSSSYWLTFKQARDLGGFIRKGEAGLPVVYWKFGTREVQDGDEIIEKSSVLCRYYTVFNLAQCEGVPRPAEEVISNPEISPIDACDQVVNGWTSSGLSAWLAQLTTRTHRNVAAVALANKLARMAWAVLAKNEAYRPPILVGAVSE
jgi:hypothetical protein